MKTHELAKALAQLSRMLSKGPNIDLDQLVLPFHFEETYYKKDDSLSLLTLAHLSNYSKADWVTVIDQYKLPIEVRPSYSTRDIMSKVLKFISENPTFAKNVVANRSFKDQKTSNTLLRALDILIGENSDRN